MVKKEECTFKLEIIQTKPHFKMDCFAKGMDNLYYSERQFRYEMLLNLHAQGLQTLEMYFNETSDEKKCNFYEDLINLMFEYDWGNL
jgi:hypothetical protein